MVRFKSILVMGVAAAMSIAFSSTSFASTFTGSSTLNVSACCGSGPFGTVTGTVVSSSEIQISVSLNSGFQFISGGQDAIFAFNTDKAVTIDNISLSGGQSSSPTPVGGGTTFSLHMDGAGFFTGGVQDTGNGASNPLGNSLSFDVTAVTGGLLFSDFISNALGNLFAADISTGCTTPGTGVTCNGSTGIVTNGGGSVVPLPGTLPLLGSVLFGGLGIARWRKNRRGPAPVVA